MRKISCLNPISPVGLNQLTDQYEISKDVRDAEGILVRSAEMKDMELPESLLAIARAGAGTNNIPVDACAGKGIVVFNTPGANANGVKELVVAGMLMAARDILGGTQWVQENADDPNIAKNAEKEKKRFAGTEISGKNLGIIGLGAIGVPVANAAHHLGMEVYGHDSYLSVKAAWNISTKVNYVAQRDDIFKLCDYITIHVPLLDSTKEMINAETIAKMKDGVVLLNFSRDLIVNEQDVLDGIESGKIYRYVTDFPTPLIAGKKGCIVMPHLGASTEESEDNCAKMAVQQMMDYLENGNIQNSVNYPNCDMGECTTVGRVAIFHQNIANQISQFTACFGENRINIQNMTNKSRGEVAYTMLDIDSKLTDDILTRLQSLEGVIRVRVIR
ncbi:MAG: phosphoglycerate dehydrogenase [Clostridium sp.]|jgi:D-3-phosphoglycerate dehydrogenase|nr:phosphoglycerate dehydrogenase [Clostridium sp.]